MVINKLQVDGELDKEFFPRLTDFVGNMPLGDVLKDDFVRELENLLEGYEEYFDDLRQLDPFINLITAPHEADEG